MLSAAAPPDPHPHELDKLLAQELESSVRAGMTGSAEAEARLASSFGSVARAECAAIVPEGAAADAVTRTTAGARIAALREEAATWRLLAHLTHDVLRSDAPDSSEAALRFETVPQHRWWCASHREAIGLRLSWDVTFRRAVMVLTWLEETHREATAHQQPYIPTGFRTETARMKQDGVDVAGVVTALDYDAPAREKKELHPADCEAERALYKAIFTLVRGGAFGAARALCEEKGYHCLATLLQETFETLQHVPGAHASLLDASLALPHAVALRCGVDSNEPAPLNNHLFSTQTALLELAVQESASGNPVAGGVYGVLVGSSDLMLGGFGAGAAARDHLWAAVRGQVEHTTLVALHSLVEGHEDYSTPDAEAALHAARPRCTTPGDAAASAFGLAGGDDAVALQLGLVRLLASGAHGSAAGLLEVFGTLEDRVMAQYPRLAAHVAMHLMRCADDLSGGSLFEDDREALGAKHDRVLRHYCRALCRAQPGDTSLLLQVVPFVASQMVDGGVRLAAELCAVLHAGGDAVAADELRMKLRRRLDATGVDAAAVFGAAAALDRSEVASQWGAPEPLQPAAGAAAEGVRLLTFVDDQSRDALAAFNAGARNLVERALLAAHEAACLNAGGVNGGSALAMWQAADRHAAEQRSALDELEGLFDRTYAHLDSQFVSAVSQLDAQRIEHAELLTLRAEAKHWEACAAALRALAAWRAVAGSEPQSAAGALEAARAARAAGSADAAAEEVLRRAGQAQLRRLHAAWAEEEARCRRELTEAVLRMVARENAGWLIDCVTLCDALHGAVRADFRVLLADREVALREMRQLVVPHVVTALLEVLAEHAEHLDPDARRKEAELVHVIADALVSDGVTQSPGLSDCFTNPDQVMHVVALLAKLDAKNS